MSSPNQSPGVSAQGAAPATKYEIDPAHTAVQFKVRHLMISNVKGEFGKVSGTVRLDPNDPTQSRIEAAIDAASINTREPQRDTHLRSADFLDAEKYPQLTFRSKSIRKLGERHYAVTGELTIRGVSRDVVLDVEGPTPPMKDPWGNTRMGGSASARIDRRDFGLTWNQALEFGGFLVGDDVDISIDVEVVSKPAA